MNEAISKTSRRILPGVEASTKVVAIPPNPALADPTTVLEAAAPGGLHDRGDNKAVVAESVRGADDLRVARTWQDS